MISRSTVTVVHTLGEMESNIFRHLCAEPSTCRQMSNLRYAGAILAQDHDTIVSTYILYTPAYSLFRALS